MKTLYLLRHAKAVEAAPTGKDHVRALAPRGHKACAALAREFKRRELKVDRVYCSTARRTRETFDALRHGLGNPEVSYRDALYLAPQEDLIAFIRALPDGHAAAMMIGHNPGLHDLALTLVGGAGKDQAKALNRMRAKFPTGAMCVLTFDLPSWKKVGDGLGTLVDFVRPRDLEKKI